MSSSTASMNKGSRQNKRPAPLKMVKEEVRQYRPPVIIHTYSPKIIHVDAAEFSSLVQSLTGRGQKRKPEASPKVREFTAEDFSCASPSSSADSGIPSGVQGPHGLISPRGPLAPFEHIYSQGFEASCVPSHAATDDTSNIFTSAVLAAATASAGPQRSPLFSNSFSNTFPHLFSPLPSPNLLSPNFLADLPALSPSTRQAFDTFGTHSFVPSPGCSSFSNSGFFTSPGSNNAFKDMALMMSRD